MLDNLEQELQILLNNYKDEEKNNLIDKINLIDKEHTKKYLEELKKYTKKEENLSNEQTRINNIVKVMNERQEIRTNIEKIIQKHSLEINLDNIPNIDKLNIFSNRLKIIETILNITNKINNNNFNKALEIFNRKEFKQVLLEFSIINNETNEELEKYLKSLIKPTISEKEASNLKILNYYHDTRKMFPNLKIPNMGLIKENTEIEIDNKMFFIN